MKTTCTATALALTIWLAPPSLNQARAAPDEARPGGGASGEARPEGTTPGGKKPEGTAPGEKKPGSAGPGDPRPAGETPSGASSSGAGSIGGAGTGQPAAPEVPPGAARPAAAAPARAPLAAKVRVAQKDRGLWLETRVRGYYTFRLSMLPSGAYMITSAASPGFVLGFKHYRLVLGLAVDFLVYSYDPKQGGKAELTGFTLGPIMQVQFFNRGPVATYCQFGAGYIYAEMDAGGAELHTNGFTVNAALGLRYYLAPSFALGVEMGTSPNFVWMKARDPSGGPPYKRRDVDMNFYGSLNAAVVW